MAKDMVDIVLEGVVYILARPVVVYVSMSTPVFSIRQSTSPSNGLANPLLELLSTPDLQSFGDNLCPKICGQTFKDLRTKVTSVAGVH